MSGNSRSAAARKRQLMVGEQGQDGSFAPATPEHAALKVLIAGGDRNESLAGLITEWGYEAIPVLDGNQAMQRLRAPAGPRIAILDWDLADIAGEEICRRLRTSPTLNYVYLILLTASSADKATGLVAGADECIKTPFDPRELHARLDVASRIVTQKASSDSERPLESAFEHAGIGMALVDLHGRWLQVNRALCDFLGYDNDELLATGNFQAVTHPDDLPKSLASLRNFQNGQRNIVQMEKRYVHKQGHTVWGSLTVSPVASCDERASHFVAQIQDISKQRRAQQALQEAHAESELFINSVPSILIGTDAAGKISRWNLAATSCFGLPASAVLGKSLLDCGIAWSMPDIQAEIESWFRIEKGAIRRDLLFNKGGEQHFLGLSINRVTFLEKKNLGLLITGVDITERRRLEEQLRQAQKLEAIGQLAAGIAHEINTPTQYVGDNITFIKQSWCAISDLARAAQLVEEEFGKGAVSQLAALRLSETVKTADLNYLLEEMPNAIDQSLEGMQRVAKIVHAMKEFSHPGSEEKTATDINRAIQITITVARNEWKYVCEVETCLDPQLPLIYCHAAEFNQVILNLLINAAHAIRQVVGDGSSGKGTIRIRTRRDGSEVEITVEDSGCGIPEAIQSRVFEPFFTTKPVGQGTGQGLALAHTVIVRRHGGRLWFETCKGKGTTFFIRLPISPVPDPPFAC